LRRVVADPKRGADFPEAPVLKIPQKQGLAVQFIKLGHSFVQKRDHLFPVLI
jgi:hypothetical protein